MQSLSLYDWVLCCRLPLPPFSFLSAENSALAWTMLEGKIKQITNK